MSGILLALAFPKFNLWWLAWVALVPFFWAENRSASLKRSLQNAFLFGAAFFAVNLFWLTSLYRFVGGWIILGWICLVLFQSLFILLLALGWHYVRNSNLAAFLIPFFWIAVEWLRAWGIFGVTAGDIGYSQAGFLPLIESAHLTTVYGISFMVVFFNIGLVDWLQKKRRSALLLAILLIALSLLYGSAVLRRPLAGGDRVKLSLIQANIDQMDKMKPHKVLSIYQTHEALTRQAMLDRPQIIIWPETAVFSYLLRDPVLLPRVKNLASQANAWLIIGTPHYEGDHIYNSIVSISPSGEVVSRYDKQRPVPFGEYLPFRPILFPLLRAVGYYDQEFSPNPFSPNLRAGKLRLASAICFESTFPDFVRRRVALGADLILVVTNDAWFDDSAAPYQHLEEGVLRAVENRKYLVQVANTGLSAVIDPYGRVVGQTRMNQARVLTLEISLP